MQVEIVKEIPKPVGQKIQEVVLRLTEREAQVLKHAGNHSRIIAAMLSGDDNVLGAVSHFPRVTDHNTIPKMEIDAVLLPLYRSLHNQGVRVQ